MTGHDQTHDISLPELGEQINEATVTVWLKSVGDTVAAGDALFEVSTDKVDSEVPSPVSGQLLEILVDEGDTIEVGTVVARVGAREPASQSGSSASRPTPLPASQSTPTEKQTTSTEEATARPAMPIARAPERHMVSVHGVDERVISPVVGELVEAHGLELSAVNGTGHGGRVTRSDAERSIAERAQIGMTVTPAQIVTTSPIAPRTEMAPTAPRHPTTPIGQDPRTVVPLNRIRARTADHMVMSKSTSPHALTAIEVDFENVDRVRRAQGPDWKEAEGFSLTYLPFILRGLATALREYPLINGSFVDSGVALNPDLNVAIAVDLAFDGLVAPVIRGIDDKRVRTLARDIVDVAGRARRIALRPDDLSGGTFTITNAGQYGTMFQYPIINQPQVAILSTDGVKRKPVAVIDSNGDECIAIHSVGVLAMAWDHRAIDGAYAAAFLDRLRRLLEDIAWEPELQ